jgi:hypothetical protein
MLDSNLIINFGNLSCFGEIPYVCSGWYEKIPIFLLYLARAHLIFSKLYLLRTMHADALATLRN